MKSSQKIIVLGAGIAGISAAYHAQEKYPNSEVIIYEKDFDWGGLCGGFELNSDAGKFWFDNFVHLSFAKDTYVKEHFNLSAEPILHTPDPTNYFKGTQIKHPAQNNLYPLKADLKVKILKDMLQNDFSSLEKIENFEQWLKVQYGNYFSEHFPMAYTRKYWTTHAKSLSVSWVGERMYCPDIEEVLFGAMSENTPCTYYAKEQRYPKRGQYRSFFKTFADKCSIVYGHKATNIDVKNQIITFEKLEHIKQKKGGGAVNVDNNIQIHFDKLISTLPLPLIPDMIGNYPDEVKEAKKELFATAGVIISLGFNQEDIAKNLWFYIYDEDIFPSRVYSPSRKSSANAPKGCSSLQAEIYFSKLRPQESFINSKNSLNQKEIQDFFLSHTIEKFVQMGICKRSHIIASDVRILPYANVVFTHDMEEKRQILRNYLQELNIISCGRFGEWDYLWSDQSFLSGKKAGQEV